MPESKHHFSNSPIFQKEEELLVLQNIAEGTAGSVGKDFFMALTKKLWETTGMIGVWVTELIEEKRLKALAFWLNGKFIENYEYDVTGSPCEAVLTSKEILYVPAKVVELFPGDPGLAELGAVSYMGIPLKDVDDKILGHLAVLDNKPMYKRPHISTILKIFAARAAAELQRLRVEKEVRDSKERLNRLVNGTHDAIIELNEKLEITQSNEAAILLFNLPNNSVPGFPLKNLLNLAGLQKITHALVHVKEMPDPVPYHWIQGYIDCRTTDGKEFPAEGTLTKYQADKRSYYILIIRNVHHRLAAEEKINILSIQTELLREEIKSIYNLEEIIGNSACMVKAMQAVQQVAVTDTTVLLTGETGTGKELFARAIYNAGHRKNRPMININCATLPGSLIESELFGHEKGAFTGAITKRQGRFAIADQGTIFLDEIGELPLDLQAKLLRVLQEGEFEPIGSNKTIKVDVRVIAATNRDLYNEVKAGKFREDLYYRLNIFPIYIPPLRNRGDDIIQLADIFLKKFSKQMAKKMFPLSAVDKQKLLSYHWPGNVRELQNVIERAVIVSNDGSISLTLEMTTHVSFTHDRKVHNENHILTAFDLVTLEKENIIRALKTTNWKISGPDGAAALLEIPSSTLSSRMKALSITR